MKKIIVILLIGVTSLTMHSQTSFKPGIKIGFNSSEIENLSDSKRKAAYVGVFGELYFENVGYAIQPEISYSQQGTENYHQDFLAITLVNKIYLSQDAFHFIIGVSMDTKLNGPKEIISADGYEKVKLESDYSALGGFGYHFPFGLGLELRGKFSLKDNENDGFGGSFGKNSIIQVGLTYKFDLNKWF